MILGRQICGDWERASRVEWLATNGLGGFASGTVAGANTRRYHGFLIASLKPPVERTLLVAKIELCVRYLEVETDLSANEFAGGAISGQGFVHVESFAVEDGIPTWRYAVADALLEQKIFMAPGANTSYLRLQLIRATAPLRATLKPLITYRDHHSQGRGPKDFKLEADTAGCRVQAFDGARGYRLSISHGQYTAAPAWYWNFWHRMEAERGLDASEDLLTPGIFTADLSPNVPVFLTATAEIAAPAAGEEIFQALKAGARHDVRRVILTSSGGPFRGRTRKELTGVTPEDALKHPTWRMGPKITIDSATLMNKALELIEARWLFQLEPDQLEVVIHPESVVHSMVEFVDGSVIAQLSPPDMRLPIQYALTYPARSEGAGERIDLGQPFSLHFEPPDRETFPCLDLGYEVMRQGGTAGAALNAANEAAVARFLKGEIGFLDISRVCRAALDNHTFDPRPTLDALWNVDARARREVDRWKT